MDEDIRAALSEIKTDQKDGFKQVNDAVKELVTRGEFRATVERLDAADRTTRTDLDNHIQYAEKTIQAERDVATAERAKAAVDRDEMRKEMHNEFEKQRVQSRWAVGIAVTVVGMIFAFVQWIGPLI